LVRNPGPPSFDRVRYLAFREIQQSFNDAYDPAPAAFPVTLLQVAGSRARGRFGDLVPDLAVLDVGGTHRTMLQWPHIEEVAAIVAAVADDCFAAS
jgi:thioesterase domain-containing protein